MDYSNLFVVLMGIGTVFTGLVCIIIIITVMGKICSKLVKAPATPAVQPAVPAAPAASAITPAMIAAISAAVAEEMGTDISAIRIVSIKKV